MRTKPNDTDPMARMITTGAACRRLGIHGDTLRTYGRLGRIASVRTEGGKLLWDIEGYLASKARENRAA